MNMVIFPNAKINLGLSVLKKRGDGFHTIESVMYPLPLSDALELVIAADNKFEFTVSGMDIPGSPENNLCMKAWKLMQDSYNLPKIKIHLRKAIPMGAGLGGGSADGAFTIKLVDQVFDLDLSVDIMENFARRLGSDCAFFIQNKPAMAFNKGDRLKPIEIDLTGYFLVLVKPEVHISTAEAYSGIKPRVPEIPVNEIIQLPVDEWKDLLKNDFEESIFNSHPVLGEIKDMLYHSGAIYASMSGSGSAIYALFKKEVELKEQFGDYFYWAWWL
jgi:4-diphosphocytidyl-2-C-methyl-D-erythritol kinase